MMTRHIVPGTWNHKSPLFWLFSIVLHISQALGCASPPGSFGMSFGLQHSETHSAVLWSVLQGRSGYSLHTQFFL